MSTKQITILVAGILAASSCAKTIEAPVDNLPEGMVSLVACHENDDATRTVRQSDGAILWNPSDNIRLFYGNTSSKFTSTNTAPAATATFTGSLGGYHFTSGENVLAVYPYSDTDVYDGQRVSLSVPNKQVATAGSFDPAAFPCIAKSSSFDLTFKNLCGGIKFRLSKSGVKKVTFRGTHSEPLGGRVVVELDESDVPVVSSMEESYSELSLSSPEGTTFKTGTWYHLVSLPAVLSAGYTMTIIYEDNHREIVKSDRSVEIKRCVFGTLTDIDKKVTERQEPAGGTEYGLYLGIIGFNTQLFYYPISLLKEKTKAGFFAFIDGLTQDDDTMLHYSVKESIRTLQVANYPDNLYSASIVTFTDGLDNVSSFYEQFQGTKEEYLTNVHRLLYQEDVAGIPLSAWTVGLLSDDAASQRKLFIQNLEQLSRPASQSVLVEDMEGVNTSFKDIASALNNSFYLYNIGMRISGPSNKERIRFTLDGVTAGEYSNKYIEGAFDMNNLSLYDVSYHGVTCTSGETVQGIRTNNRVTFQFDGLQSADNMPIDKDRFMEWRWVESAGVWQRDSEFKPGEAVSIQKVQKSAVVLLNLDCTTSLTDETHDWFPDLKNAAKEFISKLCEMAANPDRVSSVSLDKNTMSLVVGNRVRLNATVLPSTALDKSVRWSSSNSSVVTVSADGWVQATGPGKAFVTVTTNDEECTATCEVTVSKIDVTSLNLDKTELWLMPGETYPLKATVNPNNATNKEVTFTSSNKSVATVDAKGVVTALSLGTTTIKAVSTDNTSKWASCVVTVSDAPQNAVDLGLSVKWATYNLGASTPEEYGDYFAWGEIYTKSNYDWSTYKWCKGSYTTLTKYNTDSDYGTVDHRTALDLSDDAARMNWGSKWRTPTDEEWFELRNNCTWTWSTQNGEKGYVVTSRLNGNSIFLPAAGSHFGSSSTSGSKGRYWSSSLITNNTVFALILSFDSGASIRVNDVSARYYGFSVRPVFGDFIAVESLSLNKSSLSIKVGESSQLSATFSPSTATSKAITWSSSNTNVATVDLIGKVTAVSAGTATITAWSSDGKKSASCIVTVNPLHEAVDLGLTVKWATCNVGASSPEKEGDYFAWGETSPKSNYNWSTYKWGKSETDLTKYNTQSYQGTVDGMTRLELEDDAAYVNWGREWRMPTDKEWDELRMCCTWTWTRQNNTDGYKVTSKMPGYTDKSIFLPAAGVWVNTYRYYFGEFGYYWSSVIPTSKPQSAWEMASDFDSVTLSTNSHRSVGLPVRPVTE